MRLTAHEGGLRIALGRLVLGIDGDPELAAMDVLDHLLEEGRAVDIACARCSAIVRVSSNCSTRRTSFDMFVELHYLVEVAAAPGARSTQSKFEGRSAKVG